MTEVISLADPLAGPQSQMNGAIPTGARTNIQAGIQPDSALATGTDRTILVIPQGLRQGVDPMTGQGLLLISNETTANGTAPKGTTPKETTKDLPTTTLNPMKTKGIRAVMTGHLTDLKRLNNPALPKRPFF